MPVRSLSSSVLKWPDGDSVRAAARKWALDLLAKNHRVKQVGFIGSYATGREGVGSDLDLVVVLDGSLFPFERRRALVDTSTLPVPADLLIYTEGELREILGRGDRFAKELREHGVWFTGEAPLGAG